MTRNLTDQLKPTCQQLTCGTAVRVEQPPPLVLSGEAKISELHAHFSVEENVFQLEVAMDYALAVQVTYCRA